MKLELKNLAGYLPYELECMETINGERFKFQLDVLNISNVMDDIKYSRSVEPILRPLSDLTKEIEVNGEKFVPLNYLQDKVFMCEVSEFEITKSLDFEVKCEELFYISFYDMKQMIEKLYEWHFDIHGLIENNLAIDINTINQ